MSLSRAAIVDQLKEIVGADRVITDETVLKKNSIDRFRKFPDIHGIYTLPIPAAVVKLGSTEQVSRVLNFMNAHKINGVPRTGASATEGGLETVVENSVVLDGSAMNQIINIDIENMQATAQCGVPLEVLENALREKGYTTGHSPQSKPLAQMGGLVATRSIGQFSTLYGAIEDMVVGLEAVLADGTVTRIKNVPRRAAGPDQPVAGVGHQRQPGVGNKRKRPTSIQQAQHFVQLALFVMVMKTHEPLGFHPTALAQQPRPAGIFRKDHIRAFQHFPRTGRKITRVAKRRRHYP